MGPSLSRELKLKIPKALKKGHFAIAGSTGSNCRQPSISSRNEIRHTRVSRPQKVLVSKSATHDFLRRGAEVARLVSTSERVRSHLVLVRNVPSQEPGFEANDDLRDGTAALAGAHGDAGGDVAEESYGR